jgi:Zn-finger nucleic acid-binding protein
MKCPKCGNTLEEIDHQSVMLDRCVVCDGIWLDKGELELLADGNAKISQGFLLRFFAR